MDAIDYLELKKTGHVELQRVGPDAFQIRFKRYCRKTGRELAPGYDNCTRKLLDDMISGVGETITEKQKERAALQSIRAEMDALDPAQDE